MQKYPIWGFAVARVLPLNSRPEKIQNEKCVRFCGVCVCVRWLQCEGETSWFYRSVVLWWFLSPIIMTNFVHSRRTHQTNTILLLFLRAHDLICTNVNSSCFVERALSYVLNWTELLYSCFEERALSLISSLSPNTQRSRPFLQSGFTDCLLRLNGDLLRSTGIFYLSRVRYCESKRVWSHHILQNHTLLSLSRDPTQTFQSSSYDDLRRLDSRVDMTDTICVFVDLISRKSEYFVAWWVWTMRNETPSDWRVIVHLVNNCTRSIKVVCVLFDGDSVTLQNDQNDSNSIMTCVIQKMLSIHTSHGKMG